MSVLVAKLCITCGASLPQHGLTCTYCGTAHLVRADSTLGLACGSCGAPNAVDAKTCVQCRAELRVRCPECAARSPLSSTFCQECGLELRRWRAARRLLLPDRVGSTSAAERLAVEWLQDSWFRARDIQEQLRVLERTLVWVPAWRFQARAVGKVEGQASQTHYRTVTRKTTNDQGEWVDKVDSVPYQVWHHVSKEFDRREVAWQPACRAAAAFRDILDADPWPKGEGQVLDGSQLPAGQRSFEPDLPEDRAYDRLRAEVIEKVRGSLLERVELFECRLLGPPRFELAWRPIYQVVYRYRRTHGEVKVDGTSGTALGKRVTLLSQIFG